MGSSPVASTPNSQNLNQIQIPHLLQFAVDKFNIPVEVFRKPVISFYRENPLWYSKYFSTLIKRCNFSPDENKEFVTYAYNQYMGEGNFAYAYPLRCEFGLKDPSCSKRELKALVDVQSSSLRNLARRLITDRDGNDNS